MKALFTKKTILSFITSLLLVVSFFCRPTEIRIPEPPSDRHQPYNFVGRKGMVVAAHHLAAKAGLEMLKKGGNAIDAAVTTAFALNASEPFASGIGGGGFMVIYLASEKRVTVVDFREKAPSRVPREIFNDEGKIKPAGLAVAVPGTLAGWVYSLKKYGTKSLADVTQEAIKIAENGFAVSQTFSRINKDQYEKLIMNAGEGTCYLNEGFPYEPGDLFRNPELAGTLKLIASKGIDEFYKGGIAQKVVKAVNEKGGVMDLKDLALYEPVEHPPLQGTYKDYTLFTIPPPSSGGVHIDLHEAAPEYPVINAIVFHENSADLAALALMQLQIEGFEFRLEASPINLRGLSHREWGDHAQVMAILLESANASHGRLKGKTSPALIVEGKDKNYTKAAKLGRLFVPYDENGIPLKLRVARHLAAVKSILSNLEELYPEKRIEIKNMPSSSELKKVGIGPFLNPPN